MAGPLSSKNKPGDDDSWESLAEDLFGIDFHANDAGDDLGDDEEFEPQAVVAASHKEAEPAPAGFDDEEEVEFSEPVAETGDDFDDDLEAAFPEEEEGEEEPVEPRLEAKKASSPGQPAAAAAENDSFWDALNDWDWEEKPAPRKPSEPQPARETTPRSRRSEPAGRGRRERSEREPRAEAAEPRRAAESAEREARPESGEREPRGRRRRGRGRGHSEVTEPVAAPASPPPLPQTDPEPLPALEDEYELAVHGEDDDFGAGLLEPSTSRRPPERRPKPAAARTERPAAKPERSRPPEPRAAKPALPRVEEAEEDEDDFGLEPESESTSETGEEGRPRRRRRRRRRRSGETAATPVTSELADLEPEPDAEELEEPEVAEEPPRRRRERPARSAERSETPRSAARDSEQRRAFRDVPTWAEAIGMLVHRRPKSTSGWKPEPDEAEPERRPARPQGRRRRRRSS